MKPTNRFQQDTYLNFYQCFFLLLSLSLFYYCVSFSFSSSFLFILPHLLFQFLLEKSINQFYSKHTNTHNWYKIEIKARPLASQFTRLHCLLFVCQSVHLFPSVSLSVLLSILLTELFNALYIECIIEESTVGPGASVTANDAPGTLVSLGRT